MATTLLNFAAQDFVGDLVPVVTSDLPAYLTSVQGRLVLTFPDAAAYAAVTPAVAMPQGYASGTLTARVFYFTAGTSGTVEFDARVEAIADGASTDLDAGTSFDAANTGNHSVPTTAGYPKELAITLTNKDSVAIGNMFRLLLRRNPANDTVGAEVRVVCVEIREG